MLVARLLGSRRVRPRLHHGVPRRDAARSIGGFAAIADYLADDYQLGRAHQPLGLRVEFAPGGGGNRPRRRIAGPQTWRHQLRWSRTIRVSRPSGYYGYVVTHATLWSLVAFAGRQWRAGVIALAVRLAAGVVVGAGILSDRNPTRDFWLIPLRDLFGFAVWLGGAFGHNVDWRGRRLRLDPDGRICNKS